MDIGSGQNLNIFENRIKTYLAMKKNGKMGVMNENKKSMEMDKSIDLTI